jgi:hypothetical protein
LPSRLMRNRARPLAYSQPVTFHSSIHRSRPTARRFSVKGPVVATV